MRATSPTVIVVLLVASLLILIVVLRRRARLTGGRDLAEFVTDRLGLFILGVVPRIGRKADEADVAESVLSAFRTIKLNVQYAADPANPLILVLTSVGPGEGKSLVASNLALVFAESGTRTLLIDANAGRGELARTFDVPPLPGLVAVLAGTATVDAALQVSAMHANLTILPCGSSTPGASPPFVESALHALLHGLARRYDVVLVDAPSLRDEAAVVALWRAAGNTALVLRAGMSDRDAAVAASAMLASHNVRVLGAILNATSVQ